MVKRNPKQEGSNLWDCKTQVGNCPMNCNQCFANRVGACDDCDGEGFHYAQGLPIDCGKCKGTGKIGAAYIPMDEQILPTVEEVGDGIVRANCLHDSNFGKEELIEHCKRYKKVFYNTSIPKFDFPGPVVFTANPKEEDFAYVPEFSPIPHTSDLKCIEKINFDKLMFIRLRVSPTNLGLLERVIRIWTSEKIPVILTFMAYYEEDKIPSLWFNKDFGRSCVGPAGNCNFLCYEHKVRHINSYWCPTKEFMVYVLKRMKKIGGRLVTMCSTSDSYYCRDCRNCENYYYQTIRHMKETVK